MPRLWLVALSIVVLSRPVHLRAAEATWTMGASFLDAEGVGARALLWIPPGARRVNAVLLCRHTSAEALFTTDPRVRRMAARHGVAIVYLLSGLPHEFDPARGHDRVLNELLQRLAHDSGYDELARAPFLLFGHSSGGIFARRVATWAPERTVALAFHKSGLRAFEPAPATALLGIPTHAVNGQWEEFGPTPGGPTGETQWQAVRDAFLELRAAGHLASQVVEPGRGHFTWELSADHDVAFFSAALRLRLGPGGLRDVDERRGWLTTPEVKLRPLPAARPARVDDAARRLHWHLDAALARVWHRLHDGQFTKPHPEVSFVGGRADNGRTFLPPVVLGETAQIQVAPTSPQGGLLTTRVLSGPAVADGPHRFRVQPCAYHEANRRIYLLAARAEDARWQYAETAAIAEVRPKTTGRAQLIDLAPLPPRRLGDKPFRIVARASSGLPVTACVMAGPAVVRDGFLHLTTLPPRTRSAQVWLRIIQPGDEAHQTSMREVTFDVRR